jgi:hypothetical protein
MWAMFIYVTDSEQANGNHHERNKELKQEASILEI